MDDSELVDVLDEVWRWIDDFGATLDEAEWKMPSEVPGWSVQDNLVHLSSVEAMLLGRPWTGLPDAPDAAHVKNDTGARNEKAVHARRSWAGADALAEFHAVTRERIDALRSLDTAGFDADSWTPMGPGTVRTLLPFRIFDSYVHAQDMSRASGRSAATASRAAEHAIDMTAGAMPFVVGKKAAAPEGSTVVFSLTGPLARDLAIEVVDGRARVAAAVPVAATVRLVMSTVIFERLGSGRVSAEQVIASGDVAFEGDDELGRRVAAGMNYLF